MILTRLPGTIKLSKFINPNYQYINDPTNISDRLIVNLSNLKIKSMPQSLTTYHIPSINQLLLDNNNIQQCIIDSTIYSKLKTLSIQNNNMQKLSIKRSLLSKFNLQLLQINLSYNQLEFLDISFATKLTKIILHHNNLSTIILPQAFLQTLDISFNLFSNIQYSVLSGRVFPKLSSLNISHNKKSLYDLILSVNGIQLTPSLTQLDCSHNIISYFQSLPPSIKYLNLQQNQFIFDRKSIYQIIQLNNLQYLKISGNTISQHFLSLIKNKLSHQQPVIHYNTQLQIKQSPYKLYSSSINNNQSKIPSKTFNNNFTLGQQQPDRNQIDPDYNLLISNQPPNHQQNPLQLNKNNQQALQHSNVLLSAQTKLKPQKLKITIDSDTFHNHYKFYLQKLSQFMAVPPYPILHQNRNKNISVRIDPSHDQNQLNQFDLINEMFQKKGGVHYVRKVFNWAKTQKINKYFPSSVMFISLQLNKYQFASMCDGDCSRIDDAILQKHYLNYQPCSFSIYHILAKIGISQHEHLWSCLYLIEAAQL